MTHPARQRLIDDWPKIQARLDDGVTVERVARDYGVSRAVVDRLIGQRGNPPNSSKWAERNARIIALREGGKTYEELGAQFGITRQRIEQIMVRAGRSDLGVAFSIAKGLNLSERVEFRCRHCGTVKLVLPSYAKIHRYCSIACAKHDGGFMAREATNVIAMRRQGMTWQQIGNHYNRYPHHILTGLKRYAERTGINVTGVYGVYNGKRGQRRKAELVETAA